eukprot:TRINITY_DN21880_c0_g1_i1.p1 TRINITY_DN21880_c0_g1~~TRINITY_DN21880_c0_g1_i1.p1  ORF type:complete len:340 (-),score=49.56 TRINITY_DN21880_c0_g1_i1:10-1029(-)
MRIGTWNVNGIRALTRKYKESDVSFDDLLKTALNCDILCLQETKITERDLPEELLHIDGYETFYSFSTAKKGYSGVGTFARDKYTIDAKNSFGGKLPYPLGKEGRVILTDHSTFILLNIYFPNAGMEGRLEQKVIFNDFILALVCDLMQVQDRQVILTGDLNVVRDNNLDVYSEMHGERACFYKEEKAFLNKMLSLGFHDAFRELHPTERGYTWYSNKDPNARADKKGWRLDYFLISDALWKAHSDSLEFAIYTDTLGSDHCPCVLTFKNITSLGSPGSPYCAISSKKKHKQLSIASFFTAKPNQSTASKPTQQKSKKRKRNGQTSVQDYFNKRKKKDL